ncbi:hypothetical protein BH10PSE14_BH10PSE14_16800 [soil metagenome]|jgi:hypothetical protein
MIVIFVVLGLIAAVGTYLTERVDRPRRRLERMAQQPAE